MRLSQSLRQAIIQRAGNCCEYCRIRRSDEALPFHIDHILPLKLGGTDDAANLCLACYMCNLFKGPSMAAADPQTGSAALLFHPRQQAWHEHFGVAEDALLHGLTPEGRATILVLRMNHAERLIYRRYAMSIGEYPCQ